LLTTNRNGISPCRRRIGAVCYQEDTRYTEAFSKKDAMTAFYAMICVLVIAFLLDLTDTFIAVSLGIIVLYYLC
jgi:hypothetical protein